MSRARRLLDLIQALRNYRRPVSGAVLASQIGVSLRTLYRDIETLKAQGADIEGEAGVGYWLRPGFMLPPLMFSEEEIEALVLGSRWVARQTDAPLGKAARDALAKIAAVLPDHLKETLDSASLLVGAVAPAAGGTSDLPAIRAAIRSERKLIIDYRYSAGARTSRTIWPFALGFFERVRVVAAWCELRQGYRSFRADRIESIAPSDRRYPRRRQALLKEWRALDRISGSERQDY